MKSDSVKLNQLEDHCRSLKKIAVAFSGGLDSRFLCYTANRVGIAVRALHISGPHIPYRETEEAHHWAETQGISFMCIQADPLENLAIKANGPDRCYLCKHTAFNALLAETRKGEILCDGTNVSDFSGYRPGLRALKDIGVRSPLAEAGFNKDDIRYFARQTGMDRPEQKARPCLFTRYEYGLEPTAASMVSLDEAERRIEFFFSSITRQNESAPPFRLRLTKEGPILHIQTENLTRKCRESLALLLSECGFPRARVGTVKQISGYFDRQAALRGEDFSASQEQRKI